MTVFIRGARGGPVPDGITAHADGRSMSDNQSVGLVEPKSVELSADGLQLDSGISFGPITVAYETYGSLNERGDNAVLICHALSGGAHAAGFLDGQNKPGWWDVMIGPGKGFDTDRHFVICANVLGSCYGTTGPESVNPGTGRPFGMSFPVVTIRDMVRVQKALLDHLGVRSLLTVAGGSMGGMQALQWAVSYPEMVRSVVALATTHRHSAQQIAFNEVARRAVMADDHWNHGDYYGEGRLRPEKGLKLARMVGHITYLSDKGMEQKFGRRLRTRQRIGYDFQAEFEVETYLDHQGQSFVQRFDANSLLYLTKALDYFDLAAGHASLTAAFRETTTRFLLIAFSSDWLYPPYQLKEVAQAIRRASGDATYCEIHSDYGHDAFLLEHEQQQPLVKAFLERTLNESRAGA